jgi:hypothetical protein
LMRFVVVLCPTSLLWPALAFWTTTLSCRGEAKAGCHRRLVLFSVKFRGSVNPEGFEEGQAIFVRFSRTVVLYQSSSG